jgi:hypothetical protein
VKHSSKVSVELLEKVSYPAPNLKAGRGLLSCALKDTVLVEKFLVRESDGLSRIDFLRLQHVSKRKGSSPMIQTLTR